MTYQSLLDSCRPQHIVAEQSEIELPSELELQSLWFAGRFGRSFVDQDGKTIEISQFGIWNRSSGPDFLNASINIGGTERTGPIELDIHPNDWVNHGHQDNNAFSKTILHVVFENPAVKTFTRTKENKHVVQVQVPRERLQQALRLPPLQSTLAQYGRCSQPLKNTPADKLERLLEEAARYRLEQKGRIFREVASIAGKDEALWQAVAQTLGYKTNSFAFKLLAQRISIAQLKNRTDQEALLFGMAQFLGPQLLETVPQDSKDYLHQLWDSWWRIRDEFQLDSSRAIPFQTSGIRPINHPQRRLASLTYLASQWNHFSKLLNAPALNSKNVIDNLTNIENPFWSHHYTLSSAKTTKPMALIGKSRAIDLLINHLIPQAYLSNPDHAWSEYKKLPASTNNERLKRASIRLLGQRQDSAQWTKKAWMQQALLQIYQNFCLKDTSDCKNCSFPEQLKFFT